MTEEKKTTKTSAKATEKKENTKKAPAKPKIDGSTEVLVYNNTSGRLVYSARKGNGFLELDQPMDSDYLTVDELQQMRNGHRRMLEDGWIYVDDEEVLDHLRLGKLKEKVKSPDTLRDLIQSGKAQKIIEVTEKLGTSSKTMLYNIMREEVKAGNFSNLHVIKEVEKILKPSSSLLDD